MKTTKELIATLKNVIKESCPRWDDGRHCFTISDCTSPPAKYCMCGKVSRYVERVYKDENTNRNRR